MIRQADFESIVYLCWRHFCDVEVRPLAWSDFALQQNSLTQGSWVRLNTAKLGIVILVQEPIGVKLASVMFACPMASVSQGQITDALGEVANIIAGHVKTELVLHDTMAAPVALSRQQIQQCNGVQEFSLACSLQLESSLCYVLLGQENQLASLLPTPS